MNASPVVLIEDDNDDQELIQEAFDKMGLENELICFNSGTKFIDWLRETDKKPFLILCNLNLSKINGIDLRKKIDDEPELKKKSIPFVFLTTDTRKTTVEKAYETTVQGYFIKDDSFDQLQDSLQTIFKYWSLCKHPNKA